jgi:hypothetical protein
MTKKITELTADSSPALTSLLESVKDPSGTPLSRKITLNAIWNLLTSLTAKTSLVDADQISIADSAASNVAKKITWANVMVAIAAYTTTLTNKRITARVTTITSDATPTINTDNCDAVTITAQAEAITSMTTNLSGTPTNFQKLIIRIKDNGTARAITWGASFEAKGTALPTTTVISKVLTVGFIYDTVTSKWGCVASAQET